MAGRAGRLGYNENGKAIILADTPVERAQLFQKYVLGRPEDVTSSFKQRGLPTWILRLLSQVRGVREEDVPGPLANTRVENLNAEFAAHRHSENERHRPAGVAYGYPRSDRRPSGSSAGRTSALELDASVSDLRSNGMTTHVNKVHHVTTITKIARDLGEDEDWLWDIANEMEIEDGVIWVYGVGEDGVQAFTDFGIENLIELIKFYKENPTLLRR
jgi:replicative superfamily II helicase